MNSLMKYVRVSLFFLILFGLVKIAFQEREMYKVKKEIAERNQELKKIERNIGYMSNQIENKNKLEFVEQIARDELYMVRPDEYMYEAE